MKKPRFVCLISSLLALSAMVAGCNLPGGGSQQAPSGSETTGDGTSDGGGGDSSTPPVIPSSASDMYGVTFTTACATAGPYSTNQTINIAGNGSSLNLYVTYYDVSNCASSGAYAVESMVATIDSISTINSSTGQIQIDYTNGDTYWTPVSAMGVSIQDGQDSGEGGICGLGTSWALNTAVDTSTISGCNYVLGETGNEKYVSVWLTGTSGNLTLTTDGAEDGSGPCFSNGDYDQSSGTRCNSEGTNTLNDVYTEQ